PGRASPPAWRRCRGCPGWSPPSARTRPPRRRGPPGSRPRAAPPGSPPTARPGPGRPSRRDPGSSARRYGRPGAPERRVVPAHLAGRIAERCSPDLYDSGDLARAGRSAGNPVEPLVGAIRAGLGAEEAGFVHWGATSQDILDSAAMLVAKRAL